MEIRYVKIVLVLLASLQALIYAIQNVVNLDAAYQSVAYVMGNVDHVAYPASILPAITTPALVWFALLVILTFEFSTGFVAAKGAIDLWSKRKGSSDDFTGAKRFAMLGCGLGIITWFGLFGVAGGSVFQMWQTQVGTGSMNGAFQLVLSYAIVFFLVNLPDK